MLCPVDPCIYKTALSPSLLSIRRQWLSRTFSIPSDQRCRRLALPSTTNFPPPSLPACSAGQSSCSAQGHREIPGLGLWSQRADTSI